MNMIIDRMSMGNQVVENAQNQISWKRMDADNNDDNEV
jgi:hypothetical protein